LVDLAAGCWGESEKQAQNNSGLFSMENPVERIKAEAGSQLKKSPRITTNKNNTPMVARFIEASAINRATIGVNSD